MYTVRVMLLGDSSVGKTSIIKRMTEGTYKKFPSATIGIDVSRVICPYMGKNILLEMWDTAGLEKHNALLPSNIRRMNWCILVCDITKKSSIDSLERWRLIFKEYCTLEHYEMIVLANKTDKPIDEQMKEINENTINNFCEEYQMDSFLVSAESSSNISLFYNIPICDCSCYECDSRYDVFCGEKWNNRLSITASNCSHLDMPKYCIKTTGLYGGVVGTRRFCSSRHMDNRCQEIKYPDDERIYYSCVYTFPHSSPKN
ncbi:hypothetical protein SNEBB_005273 [Seison nebaliae]|nr:hypothetical protein SNEBB_005273 [Seison nebaliae]